MEFLASDDQEGRGVGTAGLDRCADFIASRFYAAGLMPAPGCENYFQPFVMTTGATIDSTRTVLKSNDQTLVLGKDYTPTSFAAERSFENVPAVFVGYGISSPNRNHYDDYAGIDVKGRAVIAMRFEPHDAAGKSRFGGDTWSIDATLIEKARAAADHGAAALILVNPPTHHGDADDLMPFARQFLGQTSPIPVFQVERAIVDAALKRANQPDLKTLQAQIDDGVKPASRELGKELAFSGNVALDRKTSNVKNVVAMLPGTGPRADEYVVVGAHYDHLGRGGGIGALGPRGEIYNGADDNASGTAAILELADRLSEDGPQPRTILFVAFTGEESGLIGSNHFVTDPPVPLRQIVAMLNLDMVGRMTNDTLLIGGAGTAASFEDLLKKADANLPLKIKEIGKGGIAPSDHMSFALRRIPVLFFFSGMHMDYHRPTDDVDKINFIGMVETIDLGERVIVALTRMEKEQYVDSADASSLGSMMGVGTGDSGSRRASLGVIPDYGTDISTGGVRITGTMPKSPAALAGLQNGDVIVQFGDRKIDNLYDLSAALAAAKPGDRVHLAVMRDGKRIETDATLAERKPEPAG